MVSSACVVAARLYLSEPVEEFCQESSNCCNRVLAVSKIAWEGMRLMSTNKRLH